MFLTFVLIHEILKKMLFHDSQLKQHAGYKLRHYQENISKENPSKDPDKYPESSVLILDPNPISLVTWVFLVSIFLVF